MNFKEFKKLPNGILELTLADTKNHSDRKFVIEKEWAIIVEKYLKLRPKNLGTTRLFVNYQKGTCTIPNVGRNKVAKWLFEIATFLNLKNAREYTGHGFRVTSTTVMAEGGSSEFDIQQTGGWKSAQVVREYIHTSTRNRRRINKDIIKYVKIASECDEDDLEQFSDSTTEELKRATTLSSASKDSIAIDKSSDSTDMTDQPPTSNTTNQPSISMNFPTNSNTKNTIPYSFPGLNFTNCTISNFNFILHKNN